MQNKQRQQHFIFEKITESFRIDIQKKIEAFVNKELGNSLEFPSNLTNIERAYIHEYIKPLGLTSRSHGQNDKRILTIYKRVLNTNTEFKELHLSEKTRRQFQEILRRNGYNDLEPMVDNDETIQLVNFKSHGNLVGDKLNDQMIPRRSKRNEFCRDSQKLPIQNYREIILNTLSKSSVSELYYN